MRCDSWKRIHAVTDKINDVNEYLKFVIVIPLMPIIAVWAVIETFKETRRERKQKELIEKRRKELETPKPKVHVIPSKDGRFELNTSNAHSLPFDKIVYVEVEHDDTIEKFFKEENAWIAKWQEWYGLEIVNLDHQLIHESLRYPQDFHVLRHGFLVNLPYTNGYRRYFEIDPDSEKTLKQQMNDIAICILDGINETAAAQM